jgi:hypothetical protein
MIAALIFVVSLAALLQFFVSYCRSIIAASSRERLSADAREAAGISEGEVPGDDFRRLVLLARLCPDAEGEGKHLRAVGAYFRMLNTLGAAMVRLAPSVAAWAESERQGCAHFAAVALDHRISFSRGLMAAQLSNRI